MRPAPAEPFQLTDPSCVRVGLTIAMLCQTVPLAAAKPLHELTRQEVRCKITYVAQGGFPSLFLLPRPGFL